MLTLQTGAVLQLQHKAQRLHNGALTTPSYPNFPLSSQNCNALDTDVKCKAMRKLENSVIPCSAEIDLNRIPTVGNLMEINWTSKTRKLRGNFRKF